MKKDLGFNLTPALEGLVLDIDGQKLKGFFSKGKKDCVKLEKEFSCKAKELVNDFNSKASAINDGWLYRFPAVNTLLQDFLTKMGISTFSEYHDYNERFQAASSFVNFGRKADWRIENIDKERYYMAKLTVKEGYHPPAPQLNTHYKDLIVLRVLAEYDYERSTLARKFERYAERAVHSLSVLGLMVAEDKTYNIPAGNIVMLSDVKRTIRDGYQTLEDALYDNLRKTCIKQLEKGDKECAKITLKMREVEAAEKQADALSELPDAVYDVANGLFSIAQAMNISTMVSSAGNNAQAAAASYLFGPCSPAHW